jgi:pyruvate-ferredoxin/flavodoxin oxidoreductase
VPAKSTGKAVMKAIDGNEATANIAYAFNDVSFIYPITPATPMGEAVDQWSNEGRINLNNNVMEVSAGASLAYITQFASLARHA